MWGGIAGTTGFMVLALIANNRWVQFKREMMRSQTARFGPVMTPGGGGLSVEGRF